MTPRGRPETWPRPRARFEPPAETLAPAALEGVRRILLIRLHALGDVVLATPAARALRGRFPGAELAMMTDDLWAPVLEGIPEIDRVIAHPKRALPRGLAGLAASAALSRDLRRQRFDLVVDLFGNPRSARLTRFSGAPIRVGYDVRGRRYAYNVRVPRHVLVDGAPRKPYAAQVDLDMLLPLGISGADARPRLALREEEERAGRALVASLGVSAGERTVALLPAGSWPAKTWPAERFARLGDLLASRAGTRVLILWGPGEEAVARRIASAMTATALVAPTLGLRELMALLRAVDLFVGNDSGPKHLAAALGTPTLALYGPTDPATWHPPWPPHAAVLVPVPCGPCDRTSCPDMRCLLAITPERVARTALAMLDGIAAGRAICYAP